MEQLLGLADGNEHVHRSGFKEYFESFYDWGPDHGDGGWLNSALTQDEAALILKVGTALDEACDSTPPIMSVDEFIASGWPERIKPLARTALDQMLKRGRFSEEAEEDEPSSTVLWP